MILRDELLNHISELLMTDQISDYCVNGLQVEGKKNISTLVTGVSAHLKFLQGAVDRGADCIIVHHGLFWKSGPHPFSLTGHMRERLKVLLDNDVNLCAYHLPLDMHSTLGNNVLICQQLDLQDLQPIDVGYYGHPKSALPLNVLIDQVKEKIHPDPFVLANGPSQVSTMAVVSGGASNQTLLDAYQCGVDTFLCGAIGEPIVYLSQELEMNFINAGHYNTEVFGVKALGEYCRKTFQLDHEFLDFPNPI